MMENVFDFYTNPFTSKLHNVESAGPDKWRASCPCGQNHKHQDKNKSLSVTYDRQREMLLVYCFTGCTVPEICSAVGCNVGDLFFGKKDPSSFISWYAEQNGLSFVESYSYCYGSYKDGLQKVRFRKPDGTKDFRWLHEDPSKKSGFTMKHNNVHRLYVAGNINSHSVFVVEGEKDANTVYNLMNITAVSAENGAARTGGKWLDEYNQQLAGKAVYILFDNDDIGKRFAEIEAEQISRTAAAVFILDLPSAWPDCPEKADITDYVKAAGAQDAADTICMLMATAEQYIPPEEPEAAAEPKRLPTGETINLANPDAAAPASAVPDAAAPWEPIKKGLSLPVFPLERLPGWIEKHIRSYAATTGVNTDYCAAAVIGTVSAVIVGHCDIIFNGSHREPAQLYSLFVGGSGTMKSSIIRHFMEPANSYLRENHKKTERTNFAIKHQIDELEKQISAARKSSKPGNQEYINELISQIEEKKKERHNNFPVPYDDVTPESLVNAMRFCRGTANIATAEGNIINVIVGRSYTQRGAIQNIDVFLKGADGESIHQHRVTTGETDIERADISMLLAIQPTLLERLCKSADAVGRGLAQRFLIYAPEETRNTIDHTFQVFIDPQHMATWTEHIKTIAGRYMDPDSPAKFMEMEPEADRIIREFWNYESALINERGANDEDSISGWLAKAHGKAMRLAAILALLRDKMAQTITGTDAENAVALFKEYYIPHFIASYEKPDNLTREERFIANWIIRRARNTGNQDSFTERELWNDIRQRNVFYGRNGRIIFSDALESLCDKNYIRPTFLKAETNRGRPSKGWIINPNIT